MEKIVFSLYLFQPIFEHYKMELRYIFTTLLVLFKIYIIFNFILKYRRMVKKVEFLENENRSLQLILAEHTSE
jgi:hypothetical protein